MLAGLSFTFRAAEFIVVVIAGLLPGPSLAFSHGEACAPVIQGNPEWSGVFSILRRLSIHRSNNVVRPVFKSMRLIKNVIKSSVKIMSL